MGVKPPLLTSGPIRGSMVLVLSPDEIAGLGKQRIGRRQNPHQIVAARKHAAANVRGRLRRSVGGDQGVLQLDGGGFRGGGIVKQASPRPGLVTGHGRVRQESVAVALVENTSAVICFGWRKSYC